MKAPLRIAVTGPAGQIGYSILFRIAAGDLLGPDQPVHLSLLERDTDESRRRLKGVMMELADCAFPLLAGMTSSSDPDEAFRDADAAFLIGAQPRGPGMERSDLLEANARIFRAQGAALNRTAKRDVKVLVVGNPCNTNAWIAMKSAPDLPAENFSAMVRLDQNRAMSLLSEKTGVPVRDIERTAVFGNHSPSLLVDLSQARLAGRPALELIDRRWFEDVLTPTVGKRGAAIIEARGKSSAAAAASAASDHMRDWMLGTNGRGAAMAVPSKGEYGVPEGIVFGYPCVCEGGRCRPVEGIEFDDFARRRFEATLAELLKERDAVAKLLG